MWAIVALGIGICLLPWACYHAWRHAWWSYRERRVLRRKYGDLRMFEAFFGREHDLARERPKRLLRGPENRPPK